MDTGTEVDMDRDMVTDIKYGHRHEHSHEQRHRLRHRHKVGTSSFHKGICYPDIVLKNFIEMY